MQPISKRATCEKGARNSDNHAPSTHELMQDGSCSAAVPQPASWQRQTEHKAFSKPALGHHGRQVVKAWWQDATRRCIKLLTCF